jgi:hypothetical protein
MTHVHHWFLAPALGAFFMAQAYAGGWPVNPLTPWFEAQHNKNGMSCCDTADGHRLDDTEWQQTADGRYSVRLKGVWTEVPPDCVLEVKRTDPIDYAVVWIWQGKIICFRPGTLT